MSADLALQQALRARFIEFAAVTALVPAVAILDRNERPAPTPSIIIGESQTVDEGTSLQRAHSRIYYTVHVWTREPSTVGAKAIVGAITLALRMRLDLDAPYHCADAYVSGSRILRDPDGEHSHAVVTVSALISEEMP